MKPWYYIVVFSLAAVLYANTAGHGFVLDDKAIITQNTFTQKGFAGIVDHFTHAYWYGMNGKNSGNYRPLSGISFSIEHALFGNNATAGHLLNILFYALLCVLLLRWLAMLRLMHPVLLFVAVLCFTAHPLHTEVVANIKSRDEIYGFLFFLLSGICYLQWLDKRSVIYIVLTCLFLLLSLLSKETAAALLPLYPMMAYAKNPTLASALKKWIAPLAVFTFYIALYVSMTDVLAENQYHLFDNALVREAPFTQLLATKIYILGKYLLLLFIPYPLRYDYSYNTIPLLSFSHPPVVLNALAIMAIIAGSIAWLYKPRSAGRRPLAFALSLLVLPLVPVSNLLFPIGSTMAERFLFVPVAGFVLLCIWLVHTVLKRWMDDRLALRVIVVTGIASTGLYGVATVLRNPAWKSDETLFTADLPHLPHNAKAHHNLANIYQHKGDLATDRTAKVTYYESAVPLLERAIEIYPVQEFYKQLGEIYGNLGRWDGVIKTRKAYLEMNPADAQAWMQLGVAEGMNGNMENALEAFEEAYALNPRDADICNNLGKTYGMLGHYEKALEMFEHAVALEPGNAEAKANLEITRRNIAR